MVINDAISVKNDVNVVNYISTHRA